MARFNIHKTPINDLNFIERSRIEDSRGSLERLFCLEEIGNLLEKQFLRQVNFTKTSLKGTVRGIHFRHDWNDEIKIVNCVRGSVYDVVVDLRPKSPTFLKWFGLEISESNRLSMVLPKGFGHSFQSLTDDVELVYFHSGLYDAQSEDGIHCQDSVLGIRWPLAIHSLSPRDQSYPPLTQERIRCLR